MDGRYAVLRLAAHLLLAPLLLAGLILLGKGLAGGVVLAAGLALHALLFGFPASLQALAPWVLRSGAAACGAALLLLLGLDRLHGLDFAFQQPPPQVRGLLLGAMLAFAAFALVQAVGARPQPLAPAAQGDPP